MKLREVTREDLMELLGVCYQYSVCEMNMSLEEFIEYSRQVWFIAGDIFCKFGMCFTVAGLRNAIIKHGSEVVKRKERA